MSTNALRSLQVLLLSCLGLICYLAAFLLLGTLCIMLVSAVVHAQTPSAAASAVRAVAASAAADTAPLPIDAGFTGSWFDPDQSGHGLMLEVLSDNRLLALWFAFDPDGDQAWFGGVGTYDGNVATITDVAQPLGGRWIPDFDANAIDRKPWGTLTFTFTDHDHGRVDFDSGAGFGSGSMNLLRLTNTAPQTPTTVPIGSPVAVTTDTAGNVYFSSEPGTIFKLDTQGRLAPIAGTGVAGFSGDGGPATQAQLNFPWVTYPEYLADPYDYSPLVAGLATDAAGNLYVADAYNNRIRRIDANGIITTVAGDGARVNAGDGGAAATASIYWPQGIGFDPAGNLFVTSAWGPLRKIAAGSGTISQLYGSNCGSAYLAPGFCVPENIAVDTAGNVYVPDGYCRVRKLAGSSLATIAGADTRPSNGSAFTCGYDGDGGPAIKAALNYPYAVAVAANGAVYVADTYNDCVRRIDTNKVITTAAGRCGVTGFGGDGGPATSARLRKPFGVAVDTAGNLYIADTGNRRIRKVGGDGTIDTVAGDGGAFVPGAIGPQFTGNWFNLAQSGHGLMIEVLPYHQFLALWFAFDPSGNQAWFGGVGTYTENRAHLADVALPVGGRWIPDFDPNAVDRKIWGTLDFTFQDCNHGTVTYDSGLGYGSGSLDIQRLTQPLGLSCP